MTTIAQPLKRRGSARPPTAMGRARSHAAARPAEADWRHARACGQVDPELFFPVGTGALARAQEKAAKKVCAGCPVRDQCLQWAVDTGQMAGVWGGLSQEERWQLGARPAARRAEAGQAHPRPVFDRCVDAQEWIEAQVAAGRSVRSIARELGVDRDVLRKARSFYLAEAAAESAGAKA